MIARKIPIPCISIRARRISIYARPEHTGKRRKNPYHIIDEEKKERRAAYRRKRRIADAVCILYDTAKEKKVWNEKLKGHFFFRVNFLTLTLPEPTTKSDRELHYTLLAPTIRILKRKLPSLRYVWRAETQANGNIHWHIITDQFIHHRDLRSIWNTVCYRAGFRKYDNPNSTDVHSLRNVKDPAAYIAKYMTKESSERRKVECKMWDCSIELKRCKPVVVEMPTQEVYNEIRILEKCGAKKDMYEYCTIINVKSMYLKYTQILSELFKQFYQQSIVNCSEAERHNNVYKVNTLQFN